MNKIFVSHRITFALAFFTVGVSSATDVWRTYHNARFGATAEVPASWRMQPPPENNDGRIFVSPDGRAKIIVSGIRALNPAPVEMADEAKPSEGETITYLKRGTRWMAVSGTKGDKIFYRKSVLSCRDTIWNHLFVEYNASEKEKYDALVAHVGASLRAGSGYDNECDPME